MELLSQHPQFSEEAGTKGFDISAGKRWIYPENYPLREYQFAIVKTALFHNTLVGLPTGLGKTFIAAVVMYNFWRWYPMGIIIFLAPTKPLVAQQIDACHDIMGIPISETIELTGTVNQQQRKKAWTKKRVIFATPQTFQKDLEKNIVPMDSIKCVVIDEAHKALGKYAYCESIRMLHEKNPYFRILALSATPGSKLEAVQEVIRNLHITHLELRDDSSTDIIPYVNDKKFDIIQVSLGNELSSFYERYLSIIDPYYRVLIQNKILNCPLKNVSKGRIFMARQDLQKRAKNSFVNGNVQKTIGIVHTMVYAKELMTNHGLRAFCNFYQTHSDKYWLKEVPDLEVLLNEIKEYLGPFPDITSLMNTGVTKVPNDVRFGHDKFLKLKDILAEHFQNAADKKVDTRAIVFVEFRDSVSEIYVLLLQLQPLIRPQIFVGQSKAGLKQKEQKQALNNFRQNKVNVLISTSVGEEGLDVGEVDLIVCFDNATHSTTRLIQRMGRTGRKRDGRIIALVTEGKENHELKSAISRKDTFNVKILKSSGVISALDNESPRMVPSDLHPECLKMRMTVIPVTPRGKSKRKAGISKKPREQKSKVDKKNVKQIANDSTGIDKWIQSDSSSVKQKNQPSLMNFLQSKPCSSSSIQDNEMTEMRVQEVQKLQVEIVLPKANNFPKVKLSDAKIISSDKAAVEFLTLCAMKESVKDLVYNKILINISYMPQDSEDDVDPFADFEIPSLQILNCIETLEEYVSSVHESPKNDFYMNDDWEPIEFSDNVNRAEQSPSLTATDLPKGQFEDLLDDSWDSDQTMYCPDDTLPTNERIELTVHEENGALQTEKINIKEENNSETADLSHSVVENGAFEDLLNTSTDDSVIELLDEDSPVKIIEDKKIISSNNTLPDKKYTPIITKALSNKVETPGSPFNIEFSSDFSALEDAQNNRLLSSTMVTSSPNVVNPRRSLNFSRISPEIATKSQVVSKRVSLFQKEKSPDLSRSSAEVKHVKSQITTPVDVKNEKSDENDNDSLELRISDDDVFGVESLLADSDFEDQITAIENCDTSDEKDVKKKSNSEKLEKNEPSEKVPDEKKNINNENHVSSKPIENNDVDETLLDDCDWSSDFEVLPAPITESKYFEKSSEAASSKKFNVGRKENTLKLNGNLLSQKENYPNWLSTSKTQSQETFSNKNKSKSNFRKILTTNSIRPTHCDSNSDDDFLPTKIEKVNFKNNERLSESSTSVRNKLTLQKNDSSKPMSITNLKIKSAVPEKFAPESSNTSGMNPPWIQPKRPFSSDNSKKRTKERRRIKKTKQRRNEFIDDEADVSCDGSVGSSDEDARSEQDSDLDDFISHTQYPDQNIDMKTHYLQSLKSPQMPGKFLIKQPRTLRPDVEIYSQVVPEQNSYVNDSFCVGDEEISEEKISSDEISILEVIEKRLEKKKRKRKDSTSSGSRSKRKRIAQCDDTSEDEMETMRAQIAEESMLFKK